MVVPFLFDPFVGRDRVPGPDPRAKHAARFLVGSDLARMRAV
jgi:hypothetical protein